LVKNIVHHPSYFVKMCWLFPYLFVEFVRETQKVGYFVPNGLE